jgi:leucyl/phenylalanyl-tRNA--protein transferase
MPDPADADEDELAGIGADLEPSTILAAYHRAMFPMPLGEDGPIGWWSPDPRGVLKIKDLHVSRSLTRSMRHFEIRVNTAFDDVMTACANPTRPHGWIDSRITQAYRQLHELGWAHSIEVWADGALAGGLYGLAIGGLFAGESMFHHQTDASKAAVAGLAQLLDDGTPRLVDVQWSTPHLATLGVTKMSRSTYIEILPELLSAPLPPFVR